MYFLVSYIIFMLNGFIAASLFFFFKNTAAGLYIVRYYKSVHKDDQPLLFELISWSIISFVNFDWRMNYIVSEYTKGFAFSVLSNIFLLALRYDASQTGSGLYTSLLNVFVVTLGTLVLAFKVTAYAFAALIEHNPQGGISCIFGPMVTVIQLPEENLPNIVQETWDLATQPTLLVYLGVVSLFVATCINELKYDQMDILIKLGICSLAGSLKVVSTKAIGIVMKLAIKGTYQITFRSFFNSLVIIVMVAAACTVLHKKFDKILQALPFLITNVRLVWTSMKMFFAKIAQTITLLIATIGPLWTKKKVLDNPQQRFHMQTLSSYNFTSEELKQATSNFDESKVIGKGGYACVYKGWLRGTDVAIKKLHSQSIELVSGLKKEMDILTTIRHRNLVTLMGACFEPLDSGPACSEPLVSAIVCEFVPNGSLEDHINGANNFHPLNWRVRTRIIAEICSALMCLHSSRPHLVIHGDLKPANILLDENFVSKLCDFGICRLIINSDEKSSKSTYNIIGTPGYIDPEFVETYKITAKSDIYSFGVIILRLVTGKPALSIARELEASIQRMPFDEMVDATAGNWPLDQARELAMLGLRCSEMRRKDRPSLNEIWSIVERHRHNFGDVR